MAQIPLKLRAPLLALSSIFLFGVVAFLMAFGQAKETRQPPSLSIKPQNCTAASSDLVILDFLYPGRTKPDLRNLPVELMGSGAIYAQACRDGTLSLNLESRNANAWAARMKVSVNDQAYQEFDVQGKVRKGIPVRRDDLVTFAFVNYAKREIRRFITVRRQVSGPWCSERPAYADGGAWINIDGTFGDITRGGHLYFRTCHSGEAVLEIRGVTDDTQPPQVNIRQNNETIYHGQLVGKKLLRIKSTGESLIEMGIENPLNRVNYERRLLIRAVSVDAGE